MKTKTAIRTLACVAVLTLGAAGAAQAQDNVFWSIGVGAPGVQVGVSNAPAVMMPPVVYPGQPVYFPQRAVVMAPRPVYYPAVPVAYGYGGYGGYGHHEYREHEGWRGGERFEHERFEHREHEHGGFERDGGRDFGREGGRGGFAGNAQFSRNVQVHTR